MISWLATISGMVGACLVAINTGLQDIGYIFFLIGSILWLYISIVRKDNAAIIQWLFFSFVNVFGLWSYLK